MKAYIVNRTTPHSKQDPDEGRYALIDESGRTLYERWCSNRAFANFDLTRGCQTILEENGITEVQSQAMDYSIYPDCNYSLQFFRRGCIRKCPFCLVRDKEGYIHPAEPVDLNPKGEWIEVLDNNFFANPEWKSAVDYLIQKAQLVKLHGVDIRIMTEEQAYWLNKLKLKGNTHIAWDLPSLDLTPKLEEVTKYIKPYKLTCYVLIGYNSTKEQDLFRIETLRKFGIVPFVQPYRDFENKRTPTQYEKDLARWANNKFLYKSCSFEDFEPRKGFKCKEYFK